MNEKDPPSSDDVVDRLCSEMERWRLNNNHNASQLADAVGVDYSSLRNWRKLAKKPKLGTVCRICRTLGLDEDYILGVSSCRRIFTTPMNRLQDHLADLENSDTAIGHRLRAQLGMLVFWHLEARSLSPQLYMVCGSHGADVSLILTGHSTAETPIRVRLYIEDTQISAGVSLYDVATDTVIRHLFRGTCSEDLCILIGDLAERYLTYYPEAPTRKPFDWESSAAEAMSHVRDHTKTRINHGITGSAG